MNRNDSIIKLNKVLEWDIVIIGGGASGLGIAVDASKRGYKTSQKNIKWIRRKKRQKYSSQKIKLISSSSKQSINSCSS